MSIFLHIFFTISYIHMDNGSQIREQMSGPDLHVFTLKFHSNFSPKKKCFFWKKKFFPPPKKFFFYLFPMQLFSADAMVFSKKKKKSFFDPEKVKKRASKVAHNQPRPFFPTNQSRPQPKAQNWLHQANYKGLQILKKDSSLNFWVFPQRTRSNQF